MAVGNWEMEVGFISHFFFFSFFHISGFLPFPVYSIIGTLAYVCFYLNVCILYVINNFHWATVCNGHEEREVTY